MTAVRGRQSPLHAASRYSAPARGDGGSLDRAAPALRQAADQVIATPGGQAALYAAVQAVLDQGDHAIVVAPYYATYPGTFRRGRRRFHRRRDAGRGRLPAARRGDREGASSRTRAPSSSTRRTIRPARSIRAERWKSIAELCREHDLWLLSDEVYWTLGGGEHVSPRALPGMAERTLVINSMSKSHGMTGWRIGWLTGPEETDHAADQPQPGRRPTA